MASIYIETFGCQMNEADSQFIADRGVSSGYAIAERPEDANVVILNTCTVRDNAERRAYGRISQFKALKDINPDMRIAVMGCLAEQDRDRMQQLAPHVDAIFGTRELVELADTVGRWRENFTDTLESEDQTLLMPIGGAPDCITDGFSHLRGFVTVQRGCSYYCTFCIVPHVRGRFDHRPEETIVAEAEGLVRKGAREIMLVGQTVNAYRDPATGSDFGDLCARVAAIEGLERLTFISPHPKDFTRKIVEDLSRLPQLNPRVHMPIQSASDAMLRRMNRKYTFAQFQERVAWINEMLPQSAITTDFIVGFPGETEGDFRATLDYAATGVFANAFTFIYSRRRGTPAARWEPAAPEVAQDRFQRLLSVQNGVTTEYHRRKVGSVVRALVQGPSKKDRARLAAKTPDNVTVIAPLPASIGIEEIARTPWLDVAIDTAHVWGITGTIVRRAVRFADAGLPVAPRVYSLLTA